MNSGQSLAYEAYERARSALVTVIMPLEADSAYVPGEQVARLVCRQGEMRRRRRIASRVAMLGFLGKEGSNMPGLAIACVDPNLKARNQRAQKQVDLEGRGFYAIFSA